MTGWFLATVSLLLAPALVALNGEPGLHDPSTVVVENGRLQGVMSTAMVYHQIESEPDREVSVEAGRRVEPQIKEI